MEKIISSGSCGVKIEEGIVPETILSLQALLLIERCLQEKLPGTCFEAAKIACSCRKRKKIRKRVSLMHSWVRFLNLEDGNALILTPSLEMLGDGITPLTPKELVKELKEAKPVYWAQSSPGGRNDQGAQGVSP